MDLKEVLKTLMNGNPDMNLLLKVLMTLGGLAFIITVYQESKNKK